MFELRPTREENGYPYNSILGGTLKTKFSIQEQHNKYKATSANGNTELIQLLDGLSYLCNKKDDGSYTWWEVNPNKIISLQNTVMDHFA